MQNAARASFAKGPQESPIPLIVENMYSSVEGYFVTY